VSGTGDGVGAAVIDCSLPTASSPTPGPMPGVYVEDAKVAALGLRLRQGRSITA